MRKAALSSRRKRRSVAGKTVCHWFHSQSVDYCSTFDGEEWWESSLCWKHCEAGRLEGRPVTFRPRRNHQQHHNTGAHSMERCVHTVGTSGANISLSVTARDLEQLQAATPTVFYCCARRRRRLRLCFLTVQLHPASFYQPLADWIYTAYSAAGLKPNKTSAVCVWAVLKIGVSFYEWKPAVWLQLHLPACKEESSDFGQETQVGCDSADPDHLLRLSQFILIRKLTAYNSTALPLKNLQAAENWLWSVLVWMFGRCPLPQKVFWITTGGAFRFKLLLPITAPLLFTQATKSDPVRRQFHSARSLKPFKLENMMMTTINKLHKNHWNKCGKAVSFPINTTVVVLLPGDTASWKWCSLSSSGKLALHVPGQEHTGVEGYYQSWRFNGQYGGMKN